MYKLISVLFLILAVVNGQGQNIIEFNADYYQSNSSIRTDDYIKFNRNQYAKNIENFDIEMETFKKIYSERVNTINIQQDMLIDSLIQTDERLNPLELLSDFSKSCVLKYRSTIPTVASTKSSIASCVNTANAQVTSMLSYPLSTRNNLNSYYVNTFEKEITNCDKKYGNYSSNYTVCVVSVTTTTNSYTITSQKNFDTYIDASYCTANANIKRALDCNFSVQNRTISLISEANTLINRCLEGGEDCRQCNQGYYCPHVFYLHQVDYKNETMFNPFYGRTELTDCLMFDIIH